MIENLDDKVLCLKQLRLSKWQLIWNREIEIKVLDEVDAPEITRAELEAKASSEVVTKARQMIEVQKQNKLSDIAIAKREIEILDKVIALLEHDTN